MLRGDGSAYFVTHVDVRYRRPARLGDDLLVVSKVHRVRASSVDIQQRVMRGQEVLADAKVTAAFLDSGGRPRRQPGDWVQKFQEITTQER
jgi:acyl-CoA thioester hydrolase